MKVPNRVLACVLLACSGVVAEAAPVSSNRIEITTLPKITEVDRRFQSYNVEMAEIVGGRFWAPYSKHGAKAEPENTRASGGLALQANLFRQRPPVDLSDRRLVNLARALGPAYVRVSGSWANTIFFQDDAQAKLAEPPKGFQNVLTRQQWAGVVAFAQAANAKITTSFSASKGARTGDGTWSPEEARKLLRYTRAIGGNIHSAELINEPNLGAFSSLPSGYNAARFARDFAILREFAKKEAPDLKLVGPGSSGEEDGKGPFPGNIDSSAMMAGPPRPDFDIFSYHFYGARSERCQKMAPGTGTSPEEALSEEWLARTDKAFAFYKGLRDRYAPGTPIWLNETAQASCGGDRWAARFADSFRYVDQLGRLAKQGVAAVFHNTLAASDYGLIDEATMTPRPNYWAAVLWARLMGSVVLDAGPAKPGLHVYAHCLRDKPGGVAVVALNLDRAQSATVSLPARADRFTLTADDLHAERIRMNGKFLALTGDRLPSLSPSRTAPGLVTLPAASITFLAVPTAANPACR